MWLVHFILLIVFPLALLSLLRVSETAMLAGALVVVFLASFLVFLGLIMYRAGTRGLTQTDPNTGAVSGVSESTRLKVAVVAILFLVYGILALVGLGVTLVTSFGNQSSPNLFGFFVAVGGWFLAAVLLLVGMIVYISFRKSLLQETGAYEAYKGRDLVTYAILNLVGVSLIVLAALASTSTSATAFLGIGFAFSFGLVPIAGIVVSVSLLRDALRLRNVQLYQAYPAPSWAAPMAPGSGMPMANAPPMPIPSAPPPPIPIAVPAWPGVAKADASAPVAAAPPPMKPRAESWVLRIQDQIEALERDVKGQQEFLRQLEREFANGRIENAAYDEIRDKRVEQIDQLEREIAAKRTQLNTGRSLEEPGL